MRIHFIAIGGSAMHNLALALHQKGYQITGSDDEIYDPSRSRLEAAGILPAAFGWDPERISKEIDAVIVGMHARIDNPELKRAESLSIPIFSYPEYIATEAQNKYRVVIAGSHGKTTTTSMVMEVLRSASIKHDFLVGAQLSGYERMVQLSDAEIMVLEGDEYLSSPIDKRPKIHHYKPHMTILTGIAWDHINVFPTFENYKSQFAIYIDTIVENGILIYNEEDINVVEVVNAMQRQDLKLIPYRQVHLNDKNEVVYKNMEPFSTPLVGNHNYQNMAGALSACQQMGVTVENFFSTMKVFQGPARRMQLVNRCEDRGSFTYLDFAHAPSKVSATVSGIKNWYPHKRIVACLELHTYSSLNINYLPLYKGAMDLADVAVVFYNNHTLEMKKMPPLSSDSIQKYFGREDLSVFTRFEEISSFVQAEEKNETIFLMMTSGNFRGLNLESILFPDM